MSEKPQVIVMLALEALLQDAWQRDDRYAFAVADEASELAGFAPGALAEMLWGTSFDEALRYREQARYRHNRALLRSKATGLLDGLRSLANIGALDGGECREARRQLWLQLVPPPEEEKS